MGSAIGNGAASRPSDGPLYLNARDFGASPSSPDNSPALQACLDKLAANMATARLVQPGGYQPNGTMYIPPGIYSMKSPLYLETNYIHVAGQGLASKLQMSPGYSYSHFIVGMQRQMTVDGKLLRADSTYRPDCFGKLDATMAPAAGRRWGFRSNGDAAITAQASGLSNGPIGPAANVPDNFATIRKLTVEFAFEVFNPFIPADPGDPAAVPARPARPAHPANTLMPNTIFATVGNSGGGAVVKIDPTPFILYTDGQNNIQGYIGTKAVRFGPTVVTNIQPPAITAPGVHRITLAVDLDTRAVTWYVDRVQVMTTPNAIPAGQIGFNPNEFYPFMLGCGDQTSLPFGKTGFPDIAVYAFNMRASCPYAVGANGSAMARTDGLRITDFNSYVPNENGSYAPDSDRASFGAIHFNEDPATFTRHLKVGTGETYTSAWLLHLNLINPGGTGSVSAVEVRDLDLGCTGNGYGMGVCLFSLLDTTVRRVKVQGGTWGIGGLNCGANYTTRILECKLQGTDSAIYAYMNIVVVSDLQIISNGRVGLRMVGCNLNANTINVAFDSPGQESFFVAHSGGYGGGFALRDINIDFEGTPYGRSLFRVEQHPYGATTCVVSNAILELAAGGVPLFELITKAGTAAPCMLSVDMVKANPSTFVKYDDPTWKGDVWHTIGAATVAPSMLAPGGGGPLNVTIH